MDQWARLAAVVAIVGTAVVYGTDVFCAVVLRPALARLDDRTLGEVTGWVHRFGDRRMPAPGALGIVGAVTSTALAVIAESTFQAIAAGVAALLLVIWLIVYIRGQCTDQPPVDDRRRRRPSAHECPCIAVSLGPRHQRAGGPAGCRAGGALRSIGRLSRRHGSTHRRSRRIPPAAARQTGSPCVSYHSAVTSQEKILLLLFLQAAVEVGLPSSPPIYQWRRRETDVHWGRSFIPVRIVSLSRANQFELAALRAHPTYDSRRAPIFGPDG